MRGCKQEQRAFNSEKGSLGLKSLEMILVRGEKHMYFETWLFSKWVPVNKSTGHGSQTETHRLPQPFPHSLSPPVRGERERDRERNREGGRERGLSLSHRENLGNTV